MLSLSRHLGAFHLHPWATHKGWLSLTGLLIFQFLQDCYKNALHCGGSIFSFLVKYLLKEADNNMGAVLVKKEVGA